MCVCVFCIFKINTNRCSTLINTWYLKSLRKPFNCVFLFKQISTSRLAIVCGKHKEMPVPQYNSVLCSAFMWIKKRYLLRVFIFGWLTFCRTTTTTKTAAHRICCFHEFFFCELFFFSVSALFVYTQGISLASTCGFT